MSRLSIPVLCLMLSGCASLPFAEILEQGVPLNERTVASGLREALTVGTERAASRLSVTDAFAGVVSRRIDIPDELDGMASRLRQIGLDGPVDDFELRMNRAAEAAVPLAVDIFSGAIQEMTIQDAFTILNGPDDSATVYFRTRTSDALAAAFRPEVDRVMTEAGVYRVYTQLIDRYNSLPLRNAPEVDLVDYIVTHATQSLFAELAVEEALIRQDPAARTTELLRRVFSKQDP